MPGTRILEPEFRKPGPECRIPNSEPGTRNLQFTIRISKPGTSKPRPKTLNLQLPSFGVVTG